MSLAATIFKEKYYRNSSYLDACLSSRPSLMWRSLWSARDLVKDGLRWRVGDGSKIKIWGSKWLSTPSSFSIQSPISLLHEDAKVEELIDKQKGEWNEVRIHELFSEMEVAQILSIPLSRGHAQDKMIWGPSKKELFSVRSAYFLQLDRLKNIRGECLVGAEMDERWENIWNIEVPSVTKMFLWKVGNSLLPTKENLFKRKVIEDKRCPVCNAET